MTFELCDELATVTIGESVQTIGGYAFHACPLKNITIPSSVTSIQSNTFTSYTSLQFIKVSDENTH